MSTFVIAPASSRYLWFIIPIMLILMIVPIIFQPNTTHTTVIAMSIGHSNSAYSFEVVRPRGSVMAAARIISCQPQK